MNCLAANGDSLSMTPRKAAGGYPRPTATAYLGLVPILEQIERVRIE
jgi:hypothetical protein